MAFSALTLLVGQRRASGPKNLSDEVLTWLSVMSAVQRLAYSPADATATSSSLLQKNPEWFILLVPAYPGSPGKKAVK